jgi:hypothetical protein
MAEVGRRMDTAMVPGGWTSPNYEHFMLNAKDSDPFLTILNSQAFVNEQLQLAADKTKALWAEKAEAIKDNNDITRLEQQIIMHLGKAFHTVMDSTSPAHTNILLYPVWFGGANVAKHSPRETYPFTSIPFGIETAKHLTKALYAKNNMMLNNAYEVYLDMVEGNPATFDFPKPPFFPSPESIYVNPFPWMVGK